MVSNNYAIPGANTQTLYGMPIVFITNTGFDEAKFRLSDKVTVSERFRTEFDIWARQFFGTVPAMYEADGVIYASASLRAQIESLEAANATR